MSLTLALIDKRIRNLIVEPPDKVINAAKAFAHLCREYNLGNEKEIEMYAYWEDAKEVMKQILKKELAWRDLGCKFQIKYKYESWAVYHNDTEWKEDVRIEWKIFGEEFTKVIKLGGGID